MHCSVALLITIFISCQRGHADSNQHCVSTPAGCLSDDVLMVQQKTVSRPAKMSTQTADAKEGRSQTSATAAPVDDHIGHAEDWKSEKDDFKEKRALLEDQLEEAQAVAAQTIKDAEAKIRQAERVAESKRINLRNKEKKLTEHKKRTFGRVWGNLWHDTENKLTKEKNNAERDHNSAKDKVQKAKDFLVEKEKNAAANEESIDNQIETSGGSFQALKATFETTLVDLKQTRTSLTKDIDDHKQEKKRKINDYDEVVKLTQAANKEELAGKKQKIDELQKQKSEAQKILDGSKSEEEDLETSIEKIKKELNDDIGKYKEQIQDAELSLAQNQDAKNDLAVHKAQLEADIKAAMDDIKEKEQNLDQNKEDLETHRNQLQDATKELQEHVQEHGVKQADIDDLQEKLNTNIENFGKTLATLIPDKQQTPTRHAKQLELTEQAHLADLAEVNSEIRIDENEHKRVDEAIKDLTQALESNLLDISDNAD